MFFNRNLIFAAIFTHNERINLNQTPIKSNNESNLCEAPLRTFLGEPQRTQSESGCAAGRDPAP